jgi:hypothetical protein
MMQKKFGVLRVIGTIFKILGILIAVAGILAAIGTLIAFLAGGNLVTQMLGTPMQAGGSVTAFAITISISILIGTLIWALSVYGIGELFFLLLAMEENTRATVLMLQASRSGSQPPPVS